MEMEAIKSSTYTWLCSNARVRAQQRHQNNRVRRPESRQEEKTSHHSKPNTGVLEHAQATSTSI